MNKFDKKDKLILLVSVTLLIVSISNLIGNHQIRQLEDKNTKLEKDLDASKDETEYYQNLYSELLNSLDTSYKDDEEKPKNVINDNFEFLVRRVKYIYDELGYDYTTDIYEGDDIFTQDFE